MEFNSTNALAQNQQLEAYKDVMAASEPQEVELSWEDVKDSFNRNQVAANVYSMMAGPEFVADPNYTVSPEDWERVTSDVPVELWDQYDEVRSKAELEHVHKELVEFNKRSQQRQALGWKGAGLDLVTSLVDIPAIVAGAGGAAIVGPVAPAAVTAFKSRAVARAVRSGIGALGGSTSTATIMQVLKENNPDFDNNDVLFAATFGAFVGATASGLRSNKSILERELGKNLATQEMLKHELRTGRLSQDMFDKAMGGLVEKGKKMGERLGVVETQDAVKQTFGGRFRADLSARLQQSENAKVRELGAKLVDDPVGRADGSVVGKTAERERALFRAPLMQDLVDDLNKYMIPLMKPIVEGKGVAGSAVNYLGRVFDKDNFQGDFLTHVGRAVRRDTGEYTKGLRDMTPEYRQAVDAIADNMRKRYTTMLKEAKALGLKGFDEIPENLNFINRVWNTAAIRQFIAEGGEEAKDDLINLFSQSLAKGSPDMKPVRVTQVARGMVQALSRADTPLGTKKLSIHLGDELRERIKEEVKDIAEDELDSILSGFVRTRKQATETGAMAPSARSRVGLDETLRITTDYSNKSIGIEDFLENNAFTLYERYINRLAGAIGLKRAGIDEDELMDTIEELIQQGKTKDAARLQGAYNLNMGYSLEDTKNLLGTLSNDKAIQTLRRGTVLAQLAYMGQVSLAQIPEMSMIAGNAGVRTFMKYIPEFRKFAKAAGNGRMEEDTFRQLNRWLSVGTQHTHFNPTTTLDDAGMVQAGRVEKLDKLGNQASHAFYNFNGMQKLTGVMRQWAVATTIERMQRMATKSFDELDPSDVRRLASAGITKGDWVTLRPLLNSKNFVLKREGAFGDIVEDLNLDALMLKNPEMGRKVAGAISRMSNKVVMTDDFGSLPLMTQTSLGKTIFQFRRFMLMSWPKIIMNAGYTKDTAEIATNFMVGTFLASMVYTGQTYLNAIGRDDAEEYIDNRFGFEEGFAPFIVRVLSRTSQGAAPIALADIGIQLVTGESMLTHSRSSDLSGSLLDLTSYPAGAIADKVISGGQGILGGALTLDRKRFAKGLDNTTDILPLANAPVFSQIYNTLDNLVAPDEE